MGTNREAVELWAVTLDGAAGDIAPLLAAVRQIADELDGHDVFDADMWREYRLSIKALREAVTSDGGDDWDDFAAGLSAPVGDTENT